MQHLFESSYPKRPYFWDRAAYDRPPDIIIFWWAVTPTGRVSKYWRTLTFNGRLDLSDDEVLTGVRQEIAAHKPRLPRGYTWSAPYQYSGRRIEGDV